jgi:para-aminobenzoate synthetase/4-amino-4-deoxychorismate lyase
MGYPFDPTVATDAVRRALARRVEPARVRILLTRAGEVTVELEDMPPTSTRPVLLTVDDEPVDGSNPWLQHKTTRRDVYLAAALRHPEADDVVLVNQRGEVTETATANVAVRLGGRWWTPPTSSGCLPGVERARLMDGGRLHERVLSVPDLESAEEIAVLNSLRGWRTARLAGSERSTGSRLSVAAGRSPAGDA